MTKLKATNTEEMIKLKKRQPENKGVSKKEENKNRMRKNGNYDESKKKEISENKKAKYKGDNKRELSHNSKYKKEKQYNKRESTENEEYKETTNDRKIIRETTNHKRIKENNSKIASKLNKKARSSPAYEYCLDDADNNEKDLILKGTINDRLNCLALLCAKNPSEQNYKQLLIFCENQRNDVIYTTLKLLRDLLKEAPVTSPYIKSRIIKSFEMGARNLYIKDKVVEIIGVLARAGIYTEDFVNVLVSRLIEKGKTLTLVQEALHSLYAANEALILPGVEDFYYKNDSFRCQYNALKFLVSVESRRTPDLFSFYDRALASLDDYPQDQKDLLIDILVSGLSATVSRGDTVTSIDIVRNYVKSARSAISVLSLLMKISDPYTETYILRVARTTLLRNTRYEHEFLNLVYKMKNSDLFAKLVDSSFYFSVPSILALMLMASEKSVCPKSLYSLRLFSIHHCPVVRHVAKKLLNSEKIPEFDPFDKVYVSGLKSMLN